MNLTHDFEYSIWNEIRQLIQDKNYPLAEEKLNTLSTQNGEWHFLYSLVLLGRAWFDSAKSHLQAAVALEPINTEYQEALAKLSYRHGRYSNDYYDGPYRRRHSNCCCCCDCCDCNVSCCDLICADTCCECMGGDLIECI